MKWEEWSGTSVDGLHLGTTFRGEMFHKVYDGGGYTVSPCGLYLDSAYWYPQREVADMALCKRCFGSTQWVPPDE